MRPLNRIIQLVSKRYFILITGLLIATGSFAQTADSVNYVQPFSKTGALRTWSIGVNGGLLIPFNEDFTTASYTQPGFGINVKNQVSSAIGIQADLFGGQAIGYNSRDNAFTQYRTQVVSAALSL